jgi:Leucine-rich repeat (LRR) protein
MDKGAFLLLRWLDLSENLISLIRNNSFSTSLSELNHLNVCLNRVEAIEPMTFEKMFALESLDLSHNLLSHLENTTFVGLFSLLFLNLNSNGIEHLQDRLFLDLTSLKELYLNTNPVRWIEDHSFANLKNMNAANLRSVQVNLNPKFVSKRGPGIEYFEAINLVYEKKSAYSEWECYLILYLAQC